jgi:hypothetical protein
MTALPRSTAPDEDLSAFVRRTQDELDRSVQICTLDNDPLRYHLSVQSMVLGATHRIFEESRGALAETIANAPHPITAADLEQHAARIAEQVSASNADAMKRGGQSIAHWAVTHLDRAATIRFWSWVLGAALGCGFAGWTLGHYVTRPAMSPVYICTATDQSGKCERGAWLTP